MKSLKIKGRVYFLSGKNEMYKGFKIIEIFEYISLGVLGKARLIRYATKHKNKYISELAIEQLKSTIDAIIEKGE